MNRAQRNDAGRRLAEPNTIPDDVKRAVSYVKSGGPLPSRVVRYAGKIKVEELIDGEKRWTLKDQVARLPDLDSERFSSWGDMIRSVMEILDQGDEGFAQLLGLPVATVRAWKQGTREPSGAGKRLLEVAVQIPDVMLYGVRTAENGEAGGTESNT